MPLTQSSSWHVSKARMRVGGRHVCELCSALAAARGTSLPTRPVYLLGSPGAADVDAAAIGAQRAWLAEVGLLGGSQRHCLHG